MSVNIGGISWTVVSKDNSGAKLVSSSSVGHSSWANANSTATGYANTVRTTYPTSTYSLNISARLPTRDDVGGNFGSANAECTDLFRTISNSYFKKGLTYWLQDRRGSGGYYIVDSNNTVCEQGSAYSEYNTLVVLTITP